MSCSTISGYTYTCLSSNGGITNIYITNNENVTGTTANGIGVLTAISLSGGNKFQTFTVRKDTCMLEEDTPINLDTLSTYYQTSLTLVIPRRSGALRDRLLVLASGQPSLSILTIDANGEAWYLDNAYLVENKSGSGTKRADANSYVLKFQRESNVPAYSVDSSAIAAIIA